MVCAQVVRSERIPQPRRQGPGRAAPPGRMARKLQTPGHNRSHAGVL